MTASGLLPIPTPSYLNLHPYLTYNILPVHISSHTYNILPAQISTCNCTILPILLNLGIPAPFNLYLHSSHTYNILPTHIITHTCTILPIHIPTQAYLHHLIYTYTHPIPIISYLLISQRRYTCTNLSIPTLTPYISHLPYLNIHLKYLTYTYLSLYLYLAYTYSILPTYTYSQNDSDVSFGKRHKGE